MTSAKSDLTGFTNFNFLSPRVFTGPTDEILQRKVDFIQKEFGATTEPIIIDTNPVGWLKNMTLRIELDALTTDEIKTSKGGTGYINWVDSIGHAIIENITLKLGNTELFNNTFPYGLWLDVYNELNDPDMLEWGMIGKHSSIDGLKKYETNKKVLYVPLHLWFSESLQSALPYFLFSSGTGLSIKIQLRSFNDLVLFSSNNQLPTGIKINKLQLIYDIIQVPDDKIISLKGQYRKKPYQIYFNHKDFFEQNLDSTVNLNFQNAPISKLIFVIRNNLRIISDNTPQINEHHSDVNGNDIFNYGNTSINNLGTYDNFETLNINTKNETDDHDLDSIYYRKVTNMNNGKHVPQKHIYMVPFDYGTKVNNFLGFLDYKSQDTLQFDFEEPASNSTITVFALTCNKLEIDKNGKTNLNNWYNNIVSSSESLSDNQNDFGLGSIGNDSYKGMYNKLYKNILDNIRTNILPKLSVCGSNQTETSMERDKYMKNDDLFIVLNKTDDKCIVLLPYNVTNYSYYLNKYVSFKEHDDNQLYKISKINPYSSSIEPIIGLFMLTLLIGKSSSSKFIDQLFINFLNIYSNSQNSKQTIIEAFKGVFKNKSHQNNSVFKDIKYLFEDSESNSSESIDLIESNKNQQIKQVLINNLCYDTFINDEDKYDFFSILSDLLIRKINNPNNIQFNKYEITLNKIDILGSDNKDTIKNTDPITYDTINDYISLRIQNINDKNNSTIFQVEDFLRNSFLYVKNTLDTDIKLEQLKKIEYKQDYITLTFILRNYKFRGIPRFANKCKEIGKIDPYMKDTFPILVKKLYKGSSISYLSLMNDFISLYKKLYLEHSKYKGYSECVDNLKMKILENIKTQIKGLRYSINKTPLKSDEPIPLIPIITLKITNEDQITTSLQKAKQDLEKWMSVGGFTIDKQPITTSDKLAKVAFEDKIAKLEKEKEDFDPLKQLTEIANIPDTSINDWLNTNREKNDYLYIDQTDGNFSLITDTDFV